MLRIFSVFTIAGFLFSFPLFAAEKKTAAVLHFHNATGNEGLSFLSRSLSEETVVAMGKTGDIQLIERENLSSVLKEIELSQSGLTGDVSPEQLSLVRADYLIMGTYSGNTSKLKVTIKAVDTRSGSVKASRNVEGSLDNIVPALQQSAQLLAVIISGKNTGTLFVESHPDGATVKINGAGYGSTPLSSLLLPAGDYDVVLEKNGYEVYRRKISIESGKEKTITADLVLARKSNEVTLTPFFAGFFPSDSETDISPGIEFGMLLGTRVQRFRFGVGYSYAPSFDDSYSYQVPYDDRDVERRYRYHRGSAYGGFDLLQTGFVIPSVYLEASYLAFQSRIFYDEATDPDEKNAKGLYTIAPGLSFELLPNSPISALAFVSYRFGLNSYEEEIYESISLTGETVTKKETINLSGTQIGLGINFKF